nr:M23 family metallopeptidase [Alloprevotella sp. Lung230]
MYKRLRYIRAYTRYQRALGTLLQEKEQAVRNKRNELASARSSKHVLLEQGKVQQTQLQTRQKEQQGVVNQLNQRQRELQTTIAHQQQQYNALNAKIDQLIQAEILAAERRRKAEEERRRKEEQRRQEAERARAAEQAARKAEQERTRQESARGSKKSAREHSTATPEPKREAARPTPPAAPRFNAPDNTDRRLSANFAANQGRLPVPITGSYTISCHFGAYNVDGLNGVRLDNKGINLTAPAGAQARCIFDGEVTAIFPMGGMSNIIVRHGSYISVYCNLSGVSVRRGQQVSTRQILGTVARDASGHCTLHFQLRHETTKLNPERWLGR